MNDNIQTLDVAQGWLEKVQGVESSNEHLHAAFVAMSSRRTPKLTVTAAPTSGGPPAENVSPDQRAREFASAANNPQDGSAPSNIGPDDVPAVVWEMVATPEVRSLVDEIVTAQAKLEKDREIGHARGLSPGQKQVLLERMEREITPGMNVEQLDELMRRRAAVEAITPGMVTSYTHGLMTQDEDQRVRAIKILDLLEPEIAKQHLAAEAIEEKFFKSNSCTRKPTEVSRRFERAAHALSSMRRALQRHPMLPYESGVWNFSVITVLGTLAKV
jgi:hypothetical protein